MSLAFITSMAIGGVLFTIAPHLPNQVALGASLLALLPALALQRSLRLHLDPVLGEA